MNTFKERTRVLFALALLAFSAFGLLWMLVAQVGWAGMAVTLAIAAFPVWLFQD